MKATVPRGTRCAAVVHREPWADKEESRIVLSGQLFRVARHDLLDLVRRRGALQVRRDLTLELTPAGVTLEYIAGPVVLKRHCTPPRHGIFYYAECESCHAQSRESKLRSTLLDRWARAHRCGKERADAPDARKRAAKR